MALFQTDHLWIKHLDEGVAALVLDRGNAPTNLIDPRMLGDLDRALDALTQTGQYRLLVVRSAKPTSFAHGPSASLLSSWTKDEFLSWADAGQALCVKLAELPMPSVAVIAGICIDAGLELALACDYRVLVDQPAATLGFPALEWGMVPCWGGTQRLPHLIGLEHSLSMLLTGAKLDAGEAWQCGLVDEICEQDDDTPPALLAAPRKRDWAVFPRRSWRERFLESNGVGRWFLFRGAERILRTRIPEEMPAPAEMLKTLREAYREPTLEAAMRCERQVLERIVDHPALRHLLRLLGQRERLRSAPEPTPIRHVGVVGGGVTALSLILHSLTKGCEVVVKTHDETSLGIALAQIVQLLRAEVDQKTMSQEFYQTLLRQIRGTYTWTHFATLDLVLDTSPGTIAERRQHCLNAEQEISPSGLLVAVNAGQSIGELGDGMQRPERFLGLHLAEPWSRGSLAEIVKSATATPGNLELLRGWLVTLGRSCWSVPDCGGSVAMRVWLPALNEAGLLLKEGVPIERIDLAMRRFGMSHGPLEWMDRLGLDRVAEVMAAMRPAFNGRVSFEGGFAGMVEKQWLGNQTGVGFYRRGAGKPRPNRDVARLWRAADSAPVLSHGDLHAWIQRRLVMLTVLEAVRCLDEQWASDADDLDCAVCLTGWATHRGGPIGYARQLGAEFVAAVCSDLEREHGPRFAPPASLAEILGPTGEPGA